MCKYLDLLLKNTTKTSNLTLIKNSFAIGSFLMAIQTLRASATTHLPDLI